MGANCSRCSCDDEVDDSRADGRLTMPGMWEDHEVEDGPSPAVAQNITLSLPIPHRQAISPAPIMEKDVEEESPKSVEVLEPENEPNLEDLTQRENEAEPVAEALSLELELTFNVQAGKVFEVGFAEASYTHFNHIVVSEISNKSPLWTTVGGGIGLREGDIVNGVNGIKGSPQEIMQGLLTTKKEGGILKLTARARVPTRTVTFTRKAREELNIALDLGNGSTDPIRVGRCSRMGVIGDWNQENAGSWVAEGDVITRVNDTPIEPGNVLAAMNKAWKDCNALTLTLETLPKFEDRLN